ncbi:hypothetical protein [Paenibacillus albidus]|uniref:hypothetical protein n=1 Tax=Paenibacillus albidus TaxID=2041023 RepID=UPI001BE9A8BA|nr:hypothetical protein [Paenibacillus albidus]
MMPETLFLQVSQRAYFTAHHAKGIFHAATGAGKQFIVLCEGHDQHIHHSYRFAVLIDLQHDTLAITGCFVGRLRFCVMDLEMAETRALLSMG